jgi:putative flippase GtrA
MWRRFGTFNVVGLGGFLLQMAALSILTRVFSWHYVVASAAAIELAILQNFVGHSRWTWSDRRPSGFRAWAACLARDQLVKSIVLATNLAVTVALVASLHVVPELASISAVAVCSFVSYVASDRLIFVSGRVVTSEEPKSKGPGLSRALRTVGRTRPLS